MSKIVTIGQATLYLGDCREILPALTDVNAVVSDPPYGIAYNPGGKPRAFKGRRYKKTYSAVDAVTGDSEPFDPAPILELGLPAILWGGNHYADALPPSAAWFVWDKRCGFGSNDFADCEMAWTSLDGPARLFRHYWNGALRDSEHGEPRWHPTLKPVVLMEWCLKQLPPECDSVVDPYMGSGTTGVACLRLGRKFAGIELEPRHFETAVQRLTEAHRQPDLFVNPPPKAEQLSLPEPTADPYADAWPDAAANSRGCWEVAIEALRKKSEGVA